MRLREIINRDSGIYVCAKFTPQTVEKLKNFLEKYKIPNPIDADEFHTTIIHSERYIPWFCKTNIKIGVKPLCWTVWDTKDEKRCLVLQLTSDFLQKRFALGRARGAETNFPDYKPHITFSYDVGDADIDLPLPDFPIIIKSEHRDTLE